jgi:4-hydroxybenzoate polyprenyltransferase/phosphoserine phosphatase
MAGPAGRKGCRGGETERRGHRYQDRHAGTDHGAHGFADRDGFFRTGPQSRSVFELCAALGRGKAAFNHRLAAQFAMDAASLPYDDAVLARIRKARSAGRPVFLASASDQRLVKAVADHLGIFAGWFASDKMNNLSGQARTQRLASEFGAGGFDYIGNEAADLPIWERATEVIAIRISAGVLRRLTKSGRQVEELSSERPTWRSWARLFRIHQYTKNALIFVPLLLAHQFSPEQVTAAILAAVAFSLCASSVYVLNDLTDIQADRNHPTKRLRPLASGEIPLLHAIAAVPILFVASGLVAVSVSIPFLGILSRYVVLTTAYSFILKRKMFIDVIVLAMLYVARLVAGAVAVQVPLSEWLLAFSMFMFMALALIKRYVELAARMDCGLTDPANRNYKLGDLDIVAALAAAAGFNAVTVFALYISSDAVHSLYRHPQLLWLICPILLYWISRALMLAHRRHMDDDPIVFALKDRDSLIAALVVGMLLIGAI